MAAVGKASRSKGPLVFSTETAATFEEAGQDVAEEIGLSEWEREALGDSPLKKLRKLFKRRLHGMIDVRTDGENIYAACRVATSYSWESYGRMKPASRSDWPAQGGSIDRTSRLLFIRKPSQAEIG